MKNHIFTLLLLTAVFVSQVPLVSAQGGLHDWSAVQAIATDTRVIVKQKDGRTVEGKMIEANATNLSLSRDNKVVNISRDSIREIHVSKGKAAKSKWAAIGAGVGAGAGLGIGATKYRSDLDDGESYLIFGTLLGTGIGAISGFAFGASRRNRELLYTAP